MMTFQEFQASITPIVARWPRGYSGDQLQLVHDEVKTISKPDFDRVVRHLLGISRIAPMVPDFRKAVSDLGIKPQFVPHPIQERAISYTNRENHTYWIRENIWANDDYVYVRPLSFIVKKFHLDHPLVLEDAEVREFRLSEIRTHLKNGTYSKLIDSWNSKSIPTSKARPVGEMKVLSFDKEVI